MRFYFGSVTNRLSFAPRRPLRGCLRAAAVAALLAAGVGGCTSASEGPMLSNLPPALGGLPAEAPARPTDGQFAYPAVHDMPPPRPDPVLTEEQVKAQEADLAKAASRNRKAGSQPVE